MGAEDDESYAGDGEGPTTLEFVESFEIGRFAVSNFEFAAFVSAEGYSTDAERFGWSFVFLGLLPDVFPPTSAVASAPWWRQVYGASWRAPEGPGSDLLGREDHPVVHVSHNDALAFCNWAEVRLPTEKEWEAAARGGLRSTKFPWGNERSPQGRHMANIFTGEFPINNDAADGFVGTAPVDSFSPNAYGLYNVIGNVWEWCSDLFAVPRMSAPATEQFVIKGGSYMCHESYCRRYRLGARSSNEPSASVGNLGFRVARSL